ncbi:DEAD/DEAH box helicase family protein [Kitasatospora sp. NPDC058406]|uniref:DEAD/DEAH box helicase family protein n=1 Tax=Kitasatospora sp. NPDC058406 TaxID=3346483 RepID=UPI0036693D13
MSGSSATEVPDPKLVELAQRSQNFGFLLPHLPLLVAYGAGAESLVFEDPNVSLFKVRQFGEVLATDLVRRGRVRIEGDRQVDRLRALEREGYLHGTVSTAFHEIRGLGNDAVHNNLADSQAAFRAVQSCFRLGVWFDRLLTGSREQRPFVPPQPRISMPNPAALDAEIEAAKVALAASRLTFENKATHADAEQDARHAAERELADARAQQDRLTEIVTAMQGELAGLRSRFDDNRSQPLPGTMATSVAERERLLSNAEIASREPLTEVQVREQLDRMLRDAGWSVQDHDAQLNLFVKERGVAVREVTMASGRADYLLYVDRKLVGVIEAKREGSDLSAAEGQADRYAEGLSAGQRLAAWRAELPYRYASDGGETRFRNTLDPDSRSRRVFSFHQPRTLSRWMRQTEEDPQAPSYRARLQLRMPELDVAGLRPAQVEAVRGVERSLADGRGQGSGLGQSRSLIQMATGAGKTFTAVTFSYRILKHARAERVLFLVDRNNLGIQARAEFENYVTPESGRKFTELYNVQRLGAEGIFTSSKVVVSTVQRLYMSLTGRELPEPAEGDPIADPYDAPSDLSVGYNADIPPEAFDLVIVDECHRSIYGKWRSVLEYFDAPIVGLTATPVAQTFGYFNGNLVSEYTYEQAVADSVNVDFNVYEIETEITGKGGVIAQGRIPVRDRRTRRQRYEEIDEDYEYSATDVGTRVITKDQLRTVISTFRDKLFTEIFPERGKRSESGQLVQSEIMVPKTLVFAKNDNHAEEIVEVIRDTFGKGNEFCAKITHKSKRSAELLSAFRNQPQLRIAVTVDMIATGTDVKPLECLLFLRDVRSWAYFEQMKGRGARTLPLTEFERVTPGVGPKTRFVIVDAVGVTKKPKIDAGPLERHTESQISLARLLQKSATLTLDDSEISTMAARLSRLEKQLTEVEQADVAKVAAKPLRDIVRGLVDAVSVDGQEAARRAGEEAAGLAGADAQARRAAGDTEVRRRVETALAPLAGNEKLRKLLLDIRRAKDILYDETSKDRLVHAGAVPEDEDTALATLASWRTYLKEHKDEIAVFSAAYDRPGVTPRAAFEHLQAIARDLARPPRAWTPERLWKAYEQVGLAVREPGVQAGVTDLVALIRHELNSEANAPAEAPPARLYAHLVEERFTAWLERQEQAGARFNDNQLWWLRHIASATAAHVRFDVDDLDYPPFSVRNGVDGLLAAFGEARADEILGELDRELSA